MFFSYTCVFKHNSKGNSSYVIQDRSGITCAKNYPEAVNNLCLCYDTDENEILNISLKKVSYNDYLYKTSDKGIIVYE